MTHVGSNSGADPLPYSSSVSLFIHAYSEQKVVSISYVAETLLGTEDKAVDKIPHSHGVYRE